MNERIFKRMLVRISTSSVNFRIGKIDRVYKKGGDLMIAAVLLLLLTGVLAFITAAIVGWQFIVVGIAAIIVVKLLKKHLFRS